ncbi:coiled-coil domain-containing protein 50 [Neocloeon triangulifer]|uniref:coiled-coil domain-containing protein 50 n=1 Tax=Neocloeon triangulifer TaxID=2078957 RepID=UPI00286F98C6|nr:coiled-coil domain-containing protein 50 [Neocloeon triangulifer]
MERELFGPRTPPADPSGRGHAINAMQCDLRNMAKNKADSETMPRRGKVSEVCREWLVHEDSALAYRLQHEEIKDHYTGNKSRNATVREDIPRARTEQQKEEEEAACIKAMYEQMLREQEEMDAEVARRLAEKLEREEEEKRLRTESRDRKIASQLQLHEQKRPRAADPDLSRPMSQMSVSDVAGPSGLQMSRRAAPLPVAENLDDLSDFCLQPDPDMTEEEARIFQEEQDAELARLLQEQESKRRGDSAIDKDRQMAVEAQDHELAKMLHDKERAKLRRAKERARLRRLQREEEAAIEGGQEGPRATGKPRYPDPPLTVAQNIAVAIDPTYKSSMPRKQMAAAEPDLITTDLDQVEDESVEDEEEEEAPPYMPIQGQRRTASLEKKKKRDQGCKQQ